MSVGVELAKIVDVFNAEQKKSDERKLLLEMLFECDSDDFDTLRTGVEDQIKEALRDADDGIAGLRVE